MRFALAFRPRVGSAAQYAREAYFPARQGAHASARYLPTAPIPVMVKLWICISLLPAHLASQNGCLQPGALLAIAKRKGAAASKHGELGVVVPPLTSAHRRFRRWRGCEGPREKTHTRSRACGASRLSPRNRLVAPPVQGLASGMRGCGKHGRGPQPAVSPQARKRGRSRDPNGSGSPVARGDTRWPERARTHGRCAARG